ncbi:MAG: cadherin-like domain-containing protein, partial [Acidobacteria bacterium]|nr:cadherin-like domain-containing protein [Acidobacteriota bacterium]
MKHYTPSFTRHNVRAFFASLLAYLLIAGQMTPLVLASNNLATRIAPSQAADIVRKGVDEAPPAGAAPAPVRLSPVPLAIAPNITATKVDSYPSSPNPAQPGETITYSVQITNNGSTATNVTLTDTVDPNTTIVPNSAGATPIATDDTFTAFGNVRISTANGAANLLANDNNPNSGNTTGLTVSGPTTGPTSGQAVVNSDGTFSYNPNPGFTGSDSFTYTVTSANGTDTATVNITVGPTLIWFINNDPGAPAGNDGRITSPFNSIASYNASAPTKDPNDIIFIYQGTSAYTGNLTLVSGMKLIGQGFALQTETGTPPAGSDPLPAATANPVVNSAAGNTVTLNTNNTIRGLTLNDSAGADITGTTFGTLTVSNVTLSGTGRPLSLTTGTLAATFDQITSTSSTGGAGILLSAVGGTMAVTNGTTITGPSAEGISVTGSTVSANFGNTSVTGGTNAVSLVTNSSGTRTFGTLSITTPSAVGFLSNGGGITNVTGAATITNPGTTGIDIQNSNAAISFAATTVNKGASTGTGVNLATNGANTTSFSSLAITTSNGVGLAASSGGSVTIGGGSITSASTGAGDGAAINALSTTLNATFATLSSTNSGGTNRGISLTTVSGGITVTSSTTVTNPGGIGINVATSAANMSFGNTTANGSAGTGVFLNANTGTIAFADLDINPDAGQRAFHATSNTNTISATSGDIVNTGAATTFEITGASTASRTPINMTLTSVSGNGGPSGIILTNVSGTAFTSATTNIQNTTAGSIAVATSTTTAIGFGTTTVNSNAGTGIFLNGNSSTFTFGALTITPDSGVRGLHATTNTGSITTPSGTITTTNATAVEIAGTSAASRTPLNIQLTTVNTTGGGVAANGIALTNTSATGSPGGFRVLGTGGTCTFSTPTCTGGRITATGGSEDISPEDNPGIGVRLFNADQVSLTRMRIDNHPNFAIHGTNVTALNLDVLVIDGNNGNNAAFEEGCIGLRELTGSGTTASSITNSFIGGGHEFIIDLRNFNGGTLNRLTVSNNT